MLRPSVPGAARPPYAGAAPNPVGGVRRRRRAQEIDSDQFVAWMTVAMALGLLLLPLLLITMSVLLRDVIPYAPIGYVLAFLSMAAFPLCGLRAMRREREGAGIEQDRVLMVGSAFFFMLLGAVYGAVLGHLLFGIVLSLRWDAGIPWRELAEVAQWVGRNGVPLSLGVVGPVLWGAHTLRGVLRRFA
ncbi:hypothetical protein LG943_21555 [Streptomonospora sp. S1-112]|uniref:Uncharacterized protein n=1 Tax=Streptomonospora mangrovi TaxID=2883123 RepID=A0A9X3SH97_9ACTN|nr:hypothetical protein [Streptomonospora mangrovi]MDA0566880.1 hypothetical protein [Streptomonospora mangrovi]